MKSETRLVWFAIIVGLVAAINAHGRRPSCCYKPKAPGPCKGSFPSWYYNKRTCTCKEFIYGGCQGNENRFDTEKECRKTCWAMKPRCKSLSSCDLKCEYGYVKDRKGCKTCECVDPCKEANCASDETCELEKVECVREPCPPIATCRPRCTRGQVWAECGRACTPTCDTQDMACIAVCTKPRCQCPSDRPIWHSGKCITAKKCPDPCNAVKCASNEVCVLKKKVATCVHICLLPKEVGTCKAKIRRWYYNKNTRCCVKFNYGGCQGNMNNFESAKACRKTCYCRYLKCTKKCEYGCALDALGCPTCDCLGHPCAAMLCMEGSQCVPTGMNTPCEGIGCPPRAKCVEVKPGTCPQLRGKQSCEPCKYDSQCRGRKKCCPVGAYTGCMNPV